MQTTVDTESAVSSRIPEPSQPIEPSAYAEALDEIQADLGRLNAGFTQLDGLRAEEQELVKSCEEITGEEKAILENQVGSEKQNLERLLKTRGLKDLRVARLAGLRKRIGAHCDVLVYDLAQPAHQKLLNLTHGLLNVRRQRIQQLFDSLFGPATDHSLPVSTEDLTRRSKPVLAVQQLCNWIDSGTPRVQEEQLALWRSEVPHRWLSELRAVAKAESEFQSFSAEQTSAEVT